jgi:hypothetical protein
VLETSFSIVGDPAEIRTGHLANKNEKQCRFSQRVLYTDVTETAYLPIMYDMVIKNAGAEERGHRGFFEDLCRYSLVEPK